MIVASIDIGSNTVLLLIANIDTETKSLNTIKNYYHAPRISQGLRPGNPIKKEKVLSLLNVLTEYNHIIKEKSIEEVYP